MLQTFILLWTGHSLNGISCYSSNHIMPRKMATWALNLLRSSPFNSPAITLSRSCGAVGGGLRWKKTISVPNFFSSHLKPAPWEASSGRPPTSWCSWGCGWISTWCQSPCRRCSTRPASSTTALAARPAVAWSRILPHKLVTSGRVWLVISCCSWYPGPAGEVGSVSRYNRHHCHFPPPPSKWDGWEQEGGLAWTRGNCDLISAFVTRPWKM